MTSKRQKHQKPSAKNPKPTQNNKNQHKPITIYLKSNQPRSNFSHSTIQASINKTRILKKIDSQTHTQREREREREGPCERERGRGPRKKKSVGAVVIRCLPKTDPPVGGALLFEFQPIPSFVLCGWLLFGFCFLKWKGFFSNFKTHSIFV